MVIRPDGAHLGAQSVADALVAVDDRRFAGKHGQHIAFGTHFDTRPTSDAMRRVDVRMLRARPFECSFPRSAAARAASSFRLVRRTCRTMESSRSRPKAT